METDENRTARDTLRLDVASGVVTLLRGEGGVLSAEDALAVLRGLQNVEAELRAAARTAMAQRLREQGHTDERLATFYLDGEPLVAD